MIPHKCSNVVVVVVFQPTIRNYNFILPYVLTPFRSPRLAAAFLLLPAALDDRRWEEHVVPHGVIAIIVLVPPFLRGRQLGTDV